MLKTVRNSAIALLAVTALTGCLDDPVVPVDPEDFHPSLEINLDEMTRLESGVYILDTTVGGGAEALDTSTVRVHYRGWMKNGYEFEDSRSLAEDPFEAKLGLQGAGALIEGWNLGLPGMREGGIRKLVIPPELGYGDRWNGPIHPNATLIFEVELFEVVGDTAAQ